MGLGFRLTEIRIKRPKRFFTFGNDNKIDASITSARLWGLGAFGTERRTWTEQSNGHHAIRHYTNRDDLIDQREIVSVSANNPIVPRESFRRRIKIISIPKFNDLI